MFFCFETLIKKREKPALGYHSQFKFMIPKVPNFFLIQGSRAPHILVTGQTPTPKRIRWILKPL